MSGTTVHVYAKDDMHFGKKPKHLKTPSSLRQAVLKDDPPLSVKLTLMNCVIEILKLFIIGFSCLYNFFKADTSLTIWNYYLAGLVFFFFKI